MLRCTIEEDDRVPDTEPMTESRTPTNSLRLLAAALAAIAALLLFAGCGTDGEQAAAEHAEETPAPERGDVIDAVIDRFGAEVGEGRDPYGELAALLVPDGTTATDEAFIDALAARLGPEYDGVRDLDVLLDALVEQVGAEGIEDLDDLLAAVSAWATDGAVSYTHLTLPTNACV